jgi:hypothetical protein
MEVRKWEKNLRGEKEKREAKTRRLEKKARKGENVEKIGICQIT